MCGQCDCHDRSGNGSGQLAGTIGLIVLIILLAGITGGDLKSIFDAESGNRWTPITGAIGFLMLYS